MRSLSFLVSRRWVIFAITVALLAYLAWILGEWQFHRLADRKEQNAIVERNTAADPVPVGEVMNVGDDVSRSDEWREVTARGEYDEANTVVVRYRTRDGASGIDVVVPLVTDEGPVLLVDRGWMGTDNSGTSPDDVPPPPSGPVTVTGWVRQDATGDSTKVTDRSTRSISSDEIGSALGLTTYGGFVDLDTEDPAPDDALEKAEPPDLSNGPHFFYGLQWWFFGLLAVGGFFYLMYDEWRGGPGAQRLRRQRRHPEDDADDAARASERPEHATVDRNHDAGHEG